MIEHFFRFYAYMLPFLDTFSWISQFIKPTDNPHHFTHCIVCFYSDEQRVSNTYLFIANVPVLDCKFHRSRNCVYPILAESIQSRTFPVSKQALMKYRLNKIPIYRHYSMLSTMFDVGHSMLNKTDMVVSFFMRLASRGKPCFI